MINFTEDYVCVSDKFLGDLYFPKYDNTIAPAIKDNGVWDEADLSIIKSMVNLGDTCINIGANVGYFACVMSKIVGDNGKVFAIEANPKFEQYLQANSASVGHNNISIIMSAAGDFIGNIDFYINETNCGDNRVFNPEIISNKQDWEKMNYSQTLSVKIDKVDNLVKDEKVNFIIIDCQGYDHSVIRGMTKIINSSKPIILTEFVPKWIEALGENPEEVLNEYKNLGYKIYIVGRSLTQDYSPKQVINFLSSKEDPCFVDLLLMPI